MSGPPKRPEWLIRKLAEIGLLGLIDLAYQQACECPACIRLRQMADEMGKREEKKDEPEKT